MGLTVVRHGQTNGNKEGILQGWTDVPLNDIGLKQARAAGNALKSVTFHQAYSSDLSRANMTCQIILEENQESSITVKNIKQDKRLRERSLGIFEGQSYSKFNEAQ